MLENFAPVIQDELQAKKGLTGLGRMLTLPVNPFSLQYNNVQNYILEHTNTQNPNNLNRSVNNLEQDFDMQMIGPITRKERREKIERYLEKKKKRNWKAIRYEVRKDLAEKRLRSHGRFVKHNKKSITELAKAYQIESISNLSSGCSSRKDSVTGLIGPMQNMNLDYENVSIAKSGL